MKVATALAVLLSMHLEAWPAVTLGMPVKHSSFVVEKFHD